ncbi:hypothetical protein ABZT03_44045 [Streptomyces sp. NPDC005574]|uniref:hypothetical protein n=1 Tax=Streptomyces sp. NPDC005574 TaxID=3156891 RepID=UPI00339E9C85
MAAFETGHLRAIKERDLHARPVAQKYPDYAFLKLSDLPWHPGDHGDHRSRAGAKLGNQSRKNSAPPWKNGMTSPKMLR